MNESSKLQNPNTKMKTPKKLQLSSSNAPVLQGGLGFGAWNLFGVWSLGFGALPRQ